MAAFNCGGPDNQGGTHWDACDCVKARGEKLEAVVIELRKVQSTLAEDGTTDLEALFEALADVDKPIGEYKRPAYIGPNAYEPGA